jgi:hypothetical protein
VQFYNSGSRKCGYAFCLVVVSSKSLNKFSSMSLGLLCGSVATISILSTYSKGVNGTGRRSEKQASGETSIGLQEAQQAMTTELLPIALSLVWMASVLLPNVGPAIGLLGGVGWAYFRNEGGEEASKGAAKCLVQKEKDHYFLLTFCFG